MASGGIFFSSKLKIVDLSTIGKQNHGRGIVSTAPIASGEILLREEAVCSSPFSSSEPNADIIKGFAKQLLEDHSWIDDLAANPKSTQRAQELLQAHPEKIIEESHQHKLVDTIGKIYTNMFIGAAPGDASSQVCALLRHTSMFNHSCDPSAATMRFEIASDSKRKKTSNSSVIISVVYALRDIAEGEEVCISYVPGLLLLPASRRQLQFQKNWGFECDCLYCRSSETRPNEALLSEASGKWDSARVKEMQDLFAQCEEAATSYRSPNQALAALKQFIQFLKLGLGRHHWRNIQIRNYFIEAAISLEDIFPQAAKDLPTVLIQQLESESLFLPQNHLDRLPYLRLAADHPRVFKERSEFERDLARLVEIESRCKTLI